MTPFGAEFWGQPIDIVLYLLLLWFGWVPIFATMIWGFIIVFQHYQQDKYDARLRFVLLSINVPLMTEQTPKAMENFFSNLAGAYSNLTWKETWVIGKFQGTFSFEIVSTDGRIQFYIRTETRYRDTIEAGVYSHYPDAEITEVDDYTAKFPRHFPNPEYELWGAELRLREDDHFPIRTYKDFEDIMTGEIKDPLGQTLELLSRMRPGEHFWIQILVHVTNNKWKEKGAEYIADLFGSKAEHKEGMFEKGLKGVLTLPGLVTEELAGVNISQALLGTKGEEEEEDPWKFFRIDPSKKDKGEGVLRKISKVGHQVKIRQVYIAKKEVYNKLARTALVKGIFNQFAHLNLNSFGLVADSVPKDDYFWQRMVFTKKQMRLMKGYCNRGWGLGASPFILNAEELATIWHFPAVGVKTPFIHKTESRRGEPPITLPVGMEDEQLPGPPSGQATAPITSVPAMAPHGHGVHEEGLVHVEPPHEEGLPTPDVHLPRKAAPPPPPRFAKKSPPARRGDPPLNLPV